jgi:hypothetical protein
VHRRPSLALIAATLLAGTLLAAARPARAQLGGAGGTGGVGGTTGTLTQSDFFIGVQQQQGVNLTTFQAQRYFNQARCNCQQPTFVFVGLTPSGAAKRATITAGTISFWVGIGCDNILTQQQNCLQLGGEQLTTFANFGSFTVQSDAQTLGKIIGSNTSVITGDGGVADGGATQIGTCSATVPYDRTLYALIDYNADGTPDLTVTSAIHVDLTPPPVPVVSSVEGGNEALVVHWADVDATIAPDILGYQILCQRGPGLQVFQTGTFGAAYQVCPGTAMGTGIDALDVNFTCSGQLGPTATSFRIEILENGIFYGASVVAIDQSGNPSPSPVQFGQPQKTFSFYDVYRQPPNAGAAAGGLCALAPGARPSLPLVLALSVMVVLRWARRRRP